MRSYLILLLFNSLTWMPIVKGELRFGPATDVNLQANVLDQIAAVVNNDVITHRELAAHLVSVKARLRRNNTPLPSEAILERQVLERLIMELLQDRAADEQRIVVNDVTVAQQIEEIAAQNGLTLGQLREQVAQSGEAFEEFREQVRREIRMARLRQRLIDREIVVSEQEVNTWLAARSGGNRLSVEGNNGASRSSAQLLYRLAHILVSLPENADLATTQAVRRKAEEVASRLQRGEDFAALSAAYSDAAQALDGGDLGWRSVDQVPMVFANVVPTLQPGQSSQVIESPSGFHFVKLVEIRQETVVNPNDNYLTSDPRRDLPSREVVQEMLRRQRIEEAWELWLRRLRAEASVDLRL